jgi:hypothetical protein
MNGIFSTQTTCFESYVIFTEEGPILRVLGGCSENAMNDIEKFIFDRI